MSTSGSYAKCCCAACTDGSSYPGMGITLPAADLRSQSIHNCERRTCAEGQLVNTHSVLLWALPSPVPHIKAAYAF